MTDDFCCEFASALAVLLIEMNAELEDFAEQVDMSLSLELEPTR
ncbi:hypothetical protein SynA1840_01439 [Synechococcus sp. A18-40]|nr:hypothetical protein SynA1840_01439 [Synechococcus sp. A18-40]